MNKPAHPQHINNPPTELLEQFLKNQSKELDLRVKELDLQRQADAHNYQYAQSSLDLQAKDRESSRVHLLSSRKTSYIFALIMFVLLAFILCYALYLNKDQIAMEIIKAAIFIISGGAGGYALGKTHKTPPSQDKQ